MTHFFQDAKFIASAPRLEHAPADRGAEVAFVGRSNAGKSSAINAITRRAKLARVSKTPGRTQQLVFFEIEPNCRLVDLPGYGYADVPDALRAGWRELIESYITRRASLRGLVLLADSRRGLTDLDLQLLEWCRHVKVPVHVLLTKSDKLTHSESRRSLDQSTRELQRVYPGSTLQLFSAVKKDGVPAAERQVIQWLRQ
jgi:GTP-binding protein